MKGQTIVGWREEKTNIFHGVFHDRPGRYQGLPIGKHVGGHSYTPIALTNLVKIGVGTILPEHLHKENEHEHMYTGRRAFGY